MKRSSISLDLTEDVDEPKLKKVKTIEAILSEMNEQDDESTEEIKEGTLSESQREALNSIIRGDNVFMTGGAGVGKSFLIEKIKEELTEMGRTYYICATTGSAAYGVEGMTIHSYAGIGLGDKEVNHHIKTIQKSSKDKVARWQATHTLIIDEISMLNADYFDKINLVAKTLRNRKTVAFGGIQVILVGDFFQIPPITPKADPNQKVLSKVGNKYAFQTQTWRELNLTMVNLKQNFRQQDDEKFKDFLNEIRIGNMTSKEEALMRNRDISRKDLVVPESATKIFPYRNDVLRTNQQELAKIHSESYFYDAEIYLCPALQRNANNNNASPTQYPVDVRVELKVGASVLLCFNMNQEFGLFNGARGTIIKFVDLSPKEKEEGEKKKESNKTEKPKRVFPMVLFDNGQKRIIREHTWSQYDKKTLLSSFTQIPLILSYAITTHKSQGLTLDAALVDVNTFCTGQFYVGASRARTFEGLFLTNFIKKKPILADPVVTAFYKKHNLL